MRLTKRIIDSAKYEGSASLGKDGKKKWSRCTLWDDEVKGLGLRVTQGGSKTFILSYRVGKRKRLMKLGSYGSLTLPKARELARRALMAVIDGEDPLSVREEKRRGVLVRELAERYIQEHAVPKKKPSSVAEDQSLLRRNVLPALGKLPVAEVTRQDIAKLHHQKRETPTDANRTVALLSKMFSLAEQWGLRPDNTNPVRHIQRFKEGKRQRYLSAEELARLGEVLLKTDEEGTEPPTAITALRLLLLTGCRKNEILALKWEEIDFDRRLILFHDSKTGYKAIPLSSAVVDILERVPRIAGNPYVLPGRGGKGHLVGLNHIWLRIRARAEIPDVRIHDLRHSFASRGAGDGLGLPILGKLLGHRSPATTARYAHLADDPLRLAAEEIASGIQSALDADRDSGKEERYERGAT